MGASRAQIVDRIIRPYLKNGGIVICDRFADSTTVYQGYARGLDQDFIQRMHAVTVKDCWPDLTILLDIDVNVGLRRTRLRNTDAEVKDRFDLEHADFHQCVREGFLDLARQNPDRIHILNADNEAEALHRQIVEIVNPLLN